MEDRSPHYLLVEMTAGLARVPLDGTLEAALTEGVERGWITDGALAMSEAQRTAFWRLREEQPEGQRLEGAQLKHDISVPPGRLADFIREGGVVCQAIMPGVRINPFGHLGDGNVHYNLTPSEGSGDFGDCGPHFAEELGALASRMKGSFAAEHGLGSSRIETANALRPPVERRLMARIKAAFDARNLLNPGVIASEEQLKQNLSEVGLS